MKLSTMADVGLKVIQGHLTGRPSPIFVIIAVTNRCNSRCSYCHIPSRYEGEMTLQQIKSLTDQVYAMGTRRIGIWGGEPLIRDDIGTIVNYILDRGIYVTLDSNGYLLPDRIDELKRLPHLLLSIDGDEKAHDSNREKGSFRKVMKAIESASSRKMNLWTITVLTRNNIDEKSIDYLLDLADEYRFNATFQVLHHTDRMGDSSTLRPSPEDYHRALDYIIRKKREGRRIGTSFKALQHIRNWQDYRLSFIPEKNSDWKCWGGKFFANVDADGSVYPCSLLVGIHPAKNFIDVGFETAYRSMPDIPCQQCLATCYSEYNLLFSLNPATILEWITAFKRKA